SVGESGNGRIGEDGLSPSRRFSVSFFFAARTSEPLRMPIGFLQASFASIFEKFIHRHQQYAGPFHVQPQIEIELVVEKMNVAMSKHAKKGAGRFEIICVNDAVLHFEIRGRVARDAVTAARYALVTH